MDAPLAEPSGATWRWPRLDPSAALKVLLAHLAVGAANASWVVVESRWDRFQPNGARLYAWELSAAVGLFLLFPLILAATLNAPRPAGRWGRFLGIHAAAYALYALLGPLLFIGLRVLLCALLGWGAYDYGPLALKLPMEWIKLLMAYTAIAFGIAAWLNFQEAQLRARREAELREKLQAAQLQALSAQLDPHFLFNALNTISSVMYEDLARTDTLLASLGQMLRDSLEAGGPAWTLQRELEHLDAFLAFVEARFGDRLRTRRSVEPGHGGCPVPRFCLQRLVENALKHNMDDPGRKLSLGIAVRADGGRLRLEVEDDGCGFADPARAQAGPGLGLRNLEEVLALQFAGRARLEVANGAAGGARVGIRVPRPGSDG